jgi:hypothetical protein
MKTRGVISLLVVATFVFFFQSAAESAEEVYDVNGCVSVEMSPLVRSQEITI